MHHKKVYIFGYGKHGSSLAKDLAVEGYEVAVIEKESVRHTKAVDDGYKVYTLDVTDDEALASLHIESDDSYLVCVMEDPHLNVFLTLSLRSIYPQSQIIAISSSVYMTQKLKLAGATMVIDTYQVSANRIHNILSKPAATELIESFVSKEYDISFREIIIPQNSFLDGKMTEDIDFSRYGVLLIGLVDIEISHKFIFITSGIKHKLDSGDILVCIGYDKDLDRFEALIRQEEI